MMKAAAAFNNCIYSVLYLILWQILANGILQIFRIAHHKGQGRAKFMLNQPQNLVAYFFHTALKICLLLCVPL